MKHCIPMALILTAALTACPSQNANVTPAPGAGPNTTTPPPAPPAPPVPDTTAPVVSSFSFVGDGTDLARFEVSASDAGGIQRAELWATAPLRLKLKANAARPAASQAPSAEMTKLLTDSEAPYAFDLGPEHNGTRDFAVRLYDAAGNVTTSQTVRASVNRADTSAPAKPAFTLPKTTFASGEQVTVTPSNIGDNVGVVAVHFVLTLEGVDTTLMTATAAPWTLTETLICPGSAAVRPAASPAQPEAPAPPATVTRSLKVVAQDEAGNSSASDVQTVTVTCPLN